ncbi:hypothetical protein [Pseudobythopirellula maris]|nr:hypothetical protein [Pseudobythopirellula maris]
MSIINPLLSSAIETFFDSMLGSEAECGGLELRSEDAATCEANSAMR